jgi:hypothetical protein
MRVAQLDALPNMRVQRTRSSPSAHREPLTRHSLGGRSLDDRGETASPRWNLGVPLKERPR